MHHRRCSTLITGYNLAYTKQPKVNIGCPNLWARGSVSRPIPCQGLSPVLLKTMIRHTIGRQEYMISQNSTEFRLCRGRESSQFFSVNSIAKWLTTLVSHIQCPPPTVWTPTTRTLVYAMASTVPTDPPLPWRSTNPAHHRWCRTCDPLSPMWHPLRCPQQRQRGAHTNFSARHGIRVDLFEATVECNGTTSTQGVMYYE